MKPSKLYRVVTTRNLTRQQFILLLKLYRYSGRPILKPITDGDVVKEGEWTTGYFRDLVCTACLHPAPTNERTAYCPNCHARMKGVYFGEKTEDRSQVCGTIPRGYVGEPHQGGVQGHNVQA